MARLITTAGDFKVYELDRNECKEHGREYPTLVCWDKDDHDIIGNMNSTENEAGTLEEMLAWCKEYSYR